MFIPLCLKFIEINSNRCNTRVSERLHDLYLRDWCIQWDKSIRSLIRTSYSQMFLKICVVKIFVKCTEKQLCRSLFFNEVAGFKPVTSLPKRLRHRCFPVNFAKFLITFFFIEHLQCLTWSDLTFVSLITDGFGF